MKQNSLADSLGCLAFKVISPLIRKLPLGMVLFLGRALGRFLYYLDFKHRAVAYANIKKALGDSLSPRQIAEMSKKFYLNFGQNLIEIFLIPLINKEYIHKYIKIEGRQYLDQAFRKGKGVILLGVHAGSWELSNLIWANLGFPFNLLVRDQKMSRLNQLLNKYRQEKGCKLIHRERQTRQLIEALKNNEAIGMTADQGGESGELVEFFGKPASMPSGAIRIALKYNAVILPGYYSRIKGPYQKVILEPPFELKLTQDKGLDIRDNLQRLISIFEKNITRYPQEYFWTYKIWKYSREREILILSDAKTGHLRQAQAVVRIINQYFSERGMQTRVETIEVKIKNKLALISSSIFSGRYNCQGCLGCLKRFLEKEVYNSLIRMKPDIVVSCGSSIAPVNFIISRENLAKSVVIMRPSLLSVKRFDLVIMPEHDRPPKAKNVCVTQGALNLIDEECLKEQSEELSQKSSFSIGLLIGGDTKQFHLPKELMQEVIRQLKSAAEKLNADILATTSRRTSPEIEKLLKQELSDDAHTRLLVIAQEKNLPQAVGGILRVSQVVITSPESISMISEAASSKKYVLVFKSPGLSKKHQRFLGHFQKSKYIYLIEPENLSKTIEEVWLNKPPVYTLQDSLLVKEAIERIL